MKRRFAGQVFWALAALFLGFPLFSFGDQTAYTTAYIPYPLEDLGHSPMAEALGSAFAAVEGDASCLFENPAGLANVSELQISAIHQSWISDITQESLVGAIRTDKLGIVALGANYLNFGTLDGYDINGNSTSSYRPYRASFSLGWGSYIYPNLSLGFSFRGLEQSLAANQDNIATSFNGGIIWTITPRLKVGGYSSFLYSDAEADLGLMKWGASYTVPVIGDKPLLILADISMPPQGVYQIQCGVEQAFLSTLSVRFGNQWDFKNQEISGFRGFTAGLGLRLVDLDINASFAPDGDLGSSVMLGLTLLFPAEPLPPPPPPPQPPSKPEPVLEPPISFKPPAVISPNDEVVWVKMQFKLPDLGPNGPSPVATPSPERDRKIDALANKVQVDPQDFQSWLSLGNLYWQAGKPDFTVQCFEEALRIKPDSAPLKSWLDQFHKLFPPISEPKE